MPDQTRNLNSVTDFAGTLDSNDRIIMTDNKASLKALTTAILGKAMIEGYTGSSLAGSSQSVKSAIDTLKDNGLYDSGALINNVDLDTYKTPGLYYCSSTGGSNFPTGVSYSALLIEVSTFANRGGVCQVCIDAVGSSKRIWRRYFVNNAWSAWVKQPERDEIETLNRKLTLYNTANNVGFELPSSKSYIKIKLLNSGGTGAEVTIDRDGNVTFDAIE